MIWLPSKDLFLLYFHWTKNLPRNNLLGLSHSPYKLWSHSHPKPCVITWEPSGLFSLVDETFLSLSCLAFLSVFRFYMLHRVCAQVGVLVLFFSFLASKSCSHVAKDSDLSILWKFLWLFPLHYLILCNIPKRRMTDFLALPMSANFSLL